jgi:hypothetical protein
MIVYQDCNGLEGIKAVSFQPIKGFGKVHRSLCAFTIAKSQRFSFEDVPKHFVKKSFIRYSWDLHLEWFAGRSGRNNGAREHRKNAQDDVARLVNDGLGMNKQS